MILSDLHLTPGVMRFYIAPEHPTETGIISRQSAHLIVKNPDAGNNRRRIEQGLINLKYAIDEYLEESQSKKPAKNCESGI